MPKKKLSENKSLPSLWRFKHGAYYYRVPKHVRHLWDGKTEFRLGSTVAEAHMTFSKRLTDFDKFVIVTMSQLCDRYQFEVLPLKSPASQRSNLNSLAFIRSVFADSPVSAIQPVHIYKFRDAIASQRSKKIANLCLEVLSHMFSKSIEWGLRSDHPMTGKKVTKFSLAPRSRYVTDEEIIAFSQVLPEYWRLYISLKLHIGLSKSDLLSIKYSDFSGNKLSVTRRKTGKKTVYTLSPSAMAIVQSVSAFGRSDIYLFATSNGDPYIKPDGQCSGFDSIWQRFMAKALSQGLIKERFTEHDLRSKVASDVSLEHAQALLQHSSSTVTVKNYRVLPDQVNSR